MEDAAQPLSTVRLGIGIALWDDFVSRALMAVVMKQGGFKQFQLGQDGGSCVSTCAENIP
jgi:hypothetical protein